MKKTQALPFKLISDKQFKPTLKVTPDLPNVLRNLRADQCSGDILAGTLPYSGTDATAGSETELQVAVTGNRADIDLVQSIEESSYFENLLKRARSGDSSEKPIQELEQFLENNQNKVWENSGVRFSYANLSEYARQILNLDLLADKRQPNGGLRSDRGRFLYGPEKNQTVRVPISYLIKLALADVIGRQKDLPLSIKLTSEKMMGHYLNDNTSPETYSFYIVPMSSETGLGKGLSRETAKRFLLTCLLVNYANQRFSS